MDSKVSMVSEFSGEGFYVAQFKTSQLAIFSYYVESKTQSLLIDPVYDVKTYNQFISKRNTTLGYVFLSHYHADYLSGHTEFKVPIVMGPSATRAVNTFKVKECTDGEEIPLGEVKVRVIHTPGHTLESSSFVLEDKHGKDSCLFSGDTVFLGEVGRPDLACSANITKEDLAGMLFDSIQKLRVLDGAIRLYPGHGSGSACGKSIGAGSFCNLQNQNVNNYGFKFTHREDFVKAVSSNLPTPPKYFFYDASLNQKGAESYDQAYNQASKALSLEQFNKSRDAKLIDTRLDVGEGIIKGSYWLPRVGPIVNWICNFVLPGQKFVIICNKGEHQDVIDRFLRVGFHHIVGYNEFDIAELKEEWVKPQILKFNTFHEVKEKTHVDLRSPAENTNDGSIQGAIRIPLPELQARVAELKDKQNIVLSCATGGRAKVAFSILAKHGLSSKVLVEEFKNFKDNGIVIVK